MSNKDFTPTSLGLIDMAQTVFFPGQTSLDPPKKDSNFQDSSKIRILIVDDQNFVCMMLQYFLKSQLDLEVVATAHSGQNALDKIEQLHPSIALVDIEMPGMNGLTITRTISEKYAQTKVLVLSNHDDNIYIREALQAGAKGYLLKDTPPEELAHAIRFVQKGYLQIGPGLLAKLEEYPYDLKIQSPSEKSVPIQLPTDYRSEEIALVSSTTASSESTSSESTLALTPSDATPFQPKRRLNLRIFLLVGAVLAAGYFGWRYFGAQTSANLLEISGRIEADETDIGAKTGGRITTILVREGDSVKTGQVVCQMEDLEVNEQLRGTTAQVSAARQEETQAKLDIEVAESRIQESATNLEQAKGDSRGRVDQAASSVSSAKAQLVQAQAQVGQARAQIKQAKAELKLAQDDRDRFSKLVREGAINRQQFEQAQTKANTAQANLDNTIAELEVRLAAVNSAADQLAALRGGLTQSESTQLNPTIRRSQLLVLQKQKQQAITRLAAAQDKVQSAIAAQQQIQKRLDSFEIKSPINGVVQDRPVEPGAVVATGRTLLTIINPKAVYLRAYVPEGDLSKIYVGKSVRVLLDSDSQPPLKAKITAIDPQASFTPENIYFKKDRVRQVFGVKIAIDQDRDYAKPGMPADAEIDLK
jgi:HlyD family secretion protein